MMNNTKRVIFIVVMIGVFIPGVLFGQNSGSFWVKTFKPGSGNPYDETIDEKSLAKLDSLMRSTDIEVLFLGGADTLRWKALSESPEISMALDQAKKLERASRLRERYGRGEIGVTDEPVRGVKVVWSPRKPDIFKMQKDLQQLQAMNDSLTSILADWNQSQMDQLAAIRDSLNALGVNGKIQIDNKVTADSYDWEIKTGMLAWSGGGARDLAVPSIGIALKREYWAFEFEGGFTPWSKPDVYGDRGDALVLGTIALFPQETFEIKTGLFSGWEFLSKTDEWTMKVMGITAGPSIKWKFIEGYLGYSIARMSTLTESEQWVNGFLINTNFKFLMN